MAITVVQHGPVNTSSYTSSGSAITLCSSSPTAGNLIALPILVYSGAAGDATDQVSGVSSAMGTTWTRVNSAIGNGGPGNANDLEWWVCASASGSGTTATATLVSGGSGSGYTVYTALLFEITAGGAALSTSDGGTEAPSSLVTSWTQTVSGLASGDLVLILESTNLTAISTGPSSPFTSYNGTSADLWSYSTGYDVAWATASGSSVSATYTASGNYPCGLALVVSPAPIAPTVVSEQGLTFNSTTAAFGALVNPNGVSTTVSFNYGIPGSFVQDIGTGVSGGQTPLTVTANTTTGNTVIVVVGGDSGFYPTGATDSRGNTYVIDAQTTSATARTISVFRAHLTTALQIGDTISFTPSSLGYGGIAGWEYEGLLTTNPDGTPATAYALGVTSISSGSISPSGQGDVLIALVSVNDYLSGGITYPSGFTSRQLYTSSALGAALALADKTPLTSGPFSSTWAGFNSGDNAAAALVAYSSSYGSSVGSVSVGSGTSPVWASVTVTGLSSNTTYHFQAVATNSSGTTDGADSVIATAPTPILSGILGQGMLGAGILGNGSGIAGTTTTASITATASLSATNTESVTDTAAISASSSLSATNKETVAETAAVTASSSLSATVAQVIGITCAISASSSLAATNKEAVALTAAISPTSSLSATNAETVALTAAISASSALAATNAQTISETASISGASSLAATVVSVTALTASVLAASSLSATNSELVALSAALSASAALAATNTESVAISAAIAATSALSASNLEKVALTAAISASAALSATVTAGSVPLTAAISATSALSASNTAAVALSAALSASSALSATNTESVALSAALAASSALSATTTELVAVTAAISGAGALSATVIKLLALSCTVTGTSALSASNTEVVLIFAACTASSTLSASNTERATLTCGISAMAALAASNQMVLPLNVAISALCALAASIGGAPVQGVANVLLACAFAPTSLTGTGAALSLSSALVVSALAGAQAQTANLSALASVENT